MMFGMKLSYLGFILVLWFSLVGCRKQRSAQPVQDINAVRTQLREQVTSGKMTQEEAVVKLAEATKEAKFGGRKKGKGKGKDHKLSPELEALGKDLKERMAKGELTEEEAKAAWFEATKGAKAAQTKTGTQGSKEPAKGKE